MSNYTDISVLLDRSGSMQSIKSAMESGFEEFLAVHREVPTTRLTLIQFDGQDPYEEVYVERPILEAPKLTLTPRGMTPLVDAVCEAIDEAGRRFARKAEAKRPSKVLFLIITDGLENASRQFSREDVKRRVKHQTSQYQWEFVFLGANQDAVLEAGRLGFDLKKAVTYDVNRVGETWRSLSKNTANYTSTHLVGAAASATLDWSEAQRSQLSGLPTPKANLCGHCGQSIYTPGTSACAPGEHYGTS